MATATERQAIPLVAVDVDDVAIDAIAAQLDAQLASRSLAVGLLSFLPTAANFPIVDLVVRQWATLRKATIAERRRHSIREDGTGIETYVVTVGLVEIVTVHRPQELQAVETREPAPGVVITLPIAPPEPPVTEPAQPKDLDDAAVRFGLLEID